jgi:excinuclease ABC subunit A
MDVIAAADWIVDIGPGAGLEGGKIVFEGTPENMLGHKESFTAKALDEYFERRSWKA